MTGSSSPSEFDAKAYRKALGGFATGVCVVTAHTAEGPLGITVNSFTSVSLDPPLVAYLPMKTSGSYARLATSQSFCVNFLAADQEGLCRSFASKAVDKFANLEWRAAPSGSPILPGVIGWVDCDTQTLHEAGDHLIVVGRVRQMATEREAPPLVFFRGGYGRFSTSYLAAGAEPDLFNHLRLVDVARPFVEQLAQSLALQCSVTVRVGAEVVLLASAGSAVDGHTLSRLGERVPFAPPLGAVHAAWGTPWNVDAWLDNLGPGASAPAREAYRAAARRVRARGWSIGLHRAQHRTLADAMASAQRAGHVPATRQALQSAVATVASTHDPEVLGDATGMVDVGVLSAPVLDAEGHSLMGLSLTGFDADLSLRQLDAFTHALQDCCARIAEALARMPETATALAA